MRQDRWHAIWSRRGLPATLLWPVSLLYGVLGALRRQLYAIGLLKSHRLPLPVIVVGNVVVGGAGKTPTVMALIAHLQAAGWRPGVVSRGYGREGDTVLEVGADTPPALCGDEPALIRRRIGVPVFVAPQRADAGRALLAAHPEVNLLVCDDGLQHLALGRDVAIAVFDERGTGNGWQLPAGLLREPWPPSSRHPFAPDLVLHQRHESGKPEKLATCGLPVFVAQRTLASQVIGPQGQRTALAGLRDSPLVAVAGIARPQAFFDMLEAAGLSLARWVALADHAPPQAYADLKLQAGDVVVCTEKDAVKVFPLLPAGVSAWSVPLELQPESAFWQALDDLLARRCPRV